MWHGSFVVRKFLLAGGALTNCLRQLGSDAPSGADSRWRDKLDHISLSDKPEPAGLQVETTDDARSFTRIVMTLVRLVV